MALFRVAKLGVLRAALWVALLLGCCMSVRHVVGRMMLGQLDALAAVVRQRRLVHHMVLL